MTFSELGLPAPLLMALADEGYTTPTPIQAKAIPAVLTGSDLLGIAQTGTGKTAAFALPILARLATNPKRPERRSARVLVLSPTRELASQIADSFRAYGRHLGVSVATVFGGVSMRPQITTMAKGVDVLVATPGRLLDHMGERTIDLSATEIFVLDEADQMLDLGFVKPIRRIVSHLSQRRQNLFFSATMPGEIAGLADDLLKDPVKIAVTPVATTAERVAQRVIHIEAAKKRTLLVELLADPAMARTLVFTRTKRGADRVARHLEAHAIGAAAIHGNKSQSQREKALLGFRDGRTRVLVATDIAARGIDVDGVTHVVNYELPEVPEAYVHRIGRTARAGASGEATSLCDGEERGLLRAIEKLTRQTIPSEDRRGDTTLARDAETKLAPEAPGDRGDRNDRYRTRERGPDTRRGSRHGSSDERKPNGEHRRSEPARDGDRKPFGARPRGEAPAQERRSSGERPHADRRASDAPRRGEDRGQNAERPRHAGGERAGGERANARGAPRQRNDQRSERPDRHYDMIGFGEVTRPAFLDGTKPRQRNAESGHRSAQGDGAKRGRPGDGDRRADGPRQGPRRHSDAGGQRHRSEGGHQRSGAGRQDRARGNGRPRTGT